LITDNNFLSLAKKIFKSTGSKLIRLSQTNYKSLFSSFISIAALQRFYSLIHPNAKNFAPLNSACFMAWGFLARQLKLQNLDGLKNIKLYGILPFGFGSENKMD
jgi:hypothetical protein